MDSSWDLYFSRRRPFNWGELCGENCILMIAHHVYLIIAPPVRGEATPIDMDFGRTQVAFNKLKVIADLNYPKPGSLTLLTLGHFKLYLLACSGQSCLSIIR